MTPKQKRAYRKTKLENRMKRIRKYGDKQHLDADQAIDNLYKLTAGTELTAAEISRYTGISHSVILKITKRAIKKIMPRMEALI